MWCGKAYTEWINFELLFYIFIYFFFFGRKYCTVWTQFGIGKKANLPKCSNLNCDLNSVNQIYFHHHIMLWKKLPFGGIMVSYLQRQIFCYMLLWISETTCEIVYNLAIYQIMWVSMVRLQSAVNEKFTMALLLKDILIFCIMVKKNGEVAYSVSLPDRIVLQHWIKQCEMAYQKRVPQTPSRSNYTSSKIDKAQKTGMWTGRAGIWITQTLSIYNW